MHTTDLLTGKVSLVAIQTTRVSEEHVQSFVEPVLEDWEGQPGFQYIIVSPFCVRADSRSTTRRTR